MLKEYTKKVFSNFSWLVFDKLVFMAVSLVVLIIVANYYGPAEYGIYQYALSLNIIFGVVVLFADEKVVKKLFSEKGEGPVLYNTFIAKLALSLISLILGFVLLLFLNESVRFNLIYLLLLINSVVINITSALIWYFDYHLKSKNIVMASSISNLISAALQIVAISLNYPITTIVLIVLFASLIKGLIILYQFNMVYGKKIIPILEKKIIFTIIKPSIPLAISGAAAMIYARTDQAMIGGILGVKQVGIYSISVQMLSVVMIAILPIQVSVYPKMIEWYKQSKALYYKRYQLISSLATWLYFFGAAISIILAPIIFENFNQEYSKSLDIFMILIIGAFFMYNSILRSSHFTITGHTQVLMVSQVLAVFINILLNYLLIPEFGITGAAISTVITLFLSLFFSNLFFKNSKNIFWIQLKGISPFFIIRKELKGLF